jgi:hypothetical protein
MSTLAKIILYLMGVKLKISVMTDDDGKKYEVVKIRHIVEPLSYAKWVSQNNYTWATEESIQDYVNYRKSLES